MAEPGIDVSVIVAVRNGAETLGQCIDSVLGQEGCTVELIIVDAMSDDGTQQIVESYGDRIATYIREPDTGIYDAWNKALNVARGEWCSFLGADDYYRGQHSLRAMLSLIPADARPGLVFAGVLRTGASHDYVVHPKPSTPHRYLQSGRMLPHTGALHRLAVLRSLGGFDAGFQVLGDYALFLKAARSGELILGVDCVPVVMRTGGLSDQTRQTHQAQQLLRERRAILHAERGAVLGEALVLWPLLRDCVARRAEAAILLMLGPRVGPRTALAIRRGLGRHERLF